MSKSKPVGRTTIEIPVDVSNEQLILAAMMADKVILRDLSRSLDHDLFLGKRHQVLFEVLREMAYNRLEFDLEVLEQIGRRREYGGRQYAQKLMEAYQTPPKNLSYHIERLRTDSLKYNLRVGPLQDLIDVSEDPSTTLEQLSELAQMVQRQMAGRFQGGVKSGHALYTHYLSDFRARVKDPGFVSTGYETLDDILTEGLARQRISIWAGRPSMGKSTLAWNIADRVANRIGVPTLHIPIEMGEVSVLDGLVSLRTGIPLNKIIKDPHKLKRSELSKINNEAFKITENENLSFWTEKLKFQQLENAINQGGYGLVVFDLWEKLVPSKDQETIATYLDRTRELVNATHCHAMLVQQIKRGVEKRENKRPTLEDLKNSGAYEENADLVCMLYRDNYYRDNVDDDELDVLEVGVPKQRRGGRLQVCYLEFEGRFGRVGRCLKNFNGVADYD